MESNKLQDRLSSSSRGAIEWAFTWAVVRGSKLIESRDILVGVLQSHGKDSPPLQILRHFSLPPDALYHELDYAPDRMASRQSIYPREDIFSPDGYQIISESLILAEKFNTKENGLVRLRDLFGGTLMADTPAQKALRIGFKSPSIHFSELVSAYLEYLEIQEDRPLASFLAERFASFAPGEDLSIQLAVSGFSADTRGERDLVGIGAEVDAFAYLIANKDLEPPLAIGLFGDWGSGKTYFMQSLKERIHEITEQARASGKPQKEIKVFKYVVQIEFNAWHYVEGELWASLVESIFQNLETQPGDKPSLLQQRQQYWIDRLEKLRDSQGIAQVLKEELEQQRQAKEQEKERIQEERKRKLGDLEELKARDVFAAIELTDDEKERFKGILQKHEVETAEDSFVEFISALDGLQAALSRGNSLTMVLQQRGPRWALAILGVILIGPLVSAAIFLLSNSEFPVVTNAMISLSTFLGGLTLLLRAGTSRLTAAIEEVERAQFALERKKREAEQQFADRIAAVEAQLAEIDQQYDQAQAEEQEIQRQIDTVEEELQQITPRRVLLDFVRERADSADYRKRLGIAALIRRDFDQLWQLIRDQNKEFIELDTGQVDKNHLHTINRIVLYIDDLDRCPPERVVQVLQAAHLLLAFPLFVVVIAVDARWLSQSLQKHYEGLLSEADRQDTSGLAQGMLRLATPQNYLEKIFQIPFWIRPLTETARMRIVQGLVEKSIRMEKDKVEGEPEEEAATASQVVWETEEHLREFKKETQLDPNPPGLDILEDELKFMADLRPLLGQTPRSVKRFVNLYWLLKSIALTQVSGFIEDKPYADFKQVLFLLAVLTGLPEISHEFFNLLDDGELLHQQMELAAGRSDSQNPDTTLKSIINVLKSLYKRQPGSGDGDEGFRDQVQRLNSWAEKYEEGLWSKIEAATLRTWLPQVIRFSYRMEET
jgi:hypothetical protein